MRTTTSLLVAALVLTAAGCGAGGSAGEGGSDLDADQFETVRSEAGRLGVAATQAAAEQLELDREPGGSRRAGADYCSGAGDGVVRIVFGSSLVYAGGTPDGARERIAEAWTGLGLDDVSTSDDEVSASASVEGVELRFVMSSPTTATDGSEREFRRVSVSSSCVDVGADLARDVTR